MEKPLKQPKTWYLILSTLAFFSFYFAIGNYALLNNNEGLYASIAKHMLLSKSFIIPYLNCVPYIEKPPLLYWLLASSFSVFGFTAFAARFVTATSATLLCITMLYFTNKIKLQKIGIISTLIFVSSIGVSVITRMVYFEMLLTLLVSSTLLCLFYWYETQKIIALRLAYILLGLAILSKGLIAIILVCGSFALFLLLEKSFWQHLRKSLDFLGITLFLSIVLPWHITAAIEHKGFLWNYIVGEHFLRFLSLREPHDYYQGQFYYYLPRILIYLFPWSFFTPLIFLKNKTLGIIEKKLLKFSWCWLVVPLIFFSISSAKANYYMIVSMPALAVILSVQLNTWFEAKHAKFFNILVSIILLAIVSIIIIGYVAFLPSFPQIISCKKLIFTIIIYGLITAIISLIFIKKPSVAAVMLAGLIIPVAITATSVLKLISDDISSAKTGIYIAEKKNISPVYIYQDFEDISALAFYSNICFKIIDNRSSDLYYGSQLPQYKQWFLTNKEFLKETRQTPSYIVVSNKKLDDFYQNIVNTKNATLQKFKDLSIIRSN